MAPAILGASLNKTKKGVRLNAAETKFFLEVSLFFRGGAGWGGIKRPFFLVDDVFVSTRH